MRQYKIYLIVEEVASHYFGCESKIYQLFAEHNKIVSAKRKLLQKQIDFITMQIPPEIIHQLLETKLRKRTDYSMKQHTHYIQFSSGRSCAKLAMNNQYITITASGTFEAETIFYEILRKHNPCFFAMDFVHNRYGWLNPIKERKYI